jgi:outer membrane protein OmpA-like peptidoglycan-associated protein
MTARGFRAAVRIILALCWSGMASAQDPGDPAEEPVLSLAADGDGWRLEWTTEPGRTYKLERSGNLVDWDEVVTLTAQGASTEVVDVLPAGTRVGFWRVSVLGGGGGPAISGIVPAFLAGGGGNETGLALSITGGAPVSSVEFLDGGVALGDAMPGLGDEWNFLLEFDPEGPRVRQLSVRVTTATGEVIETEAAGLLVADPSRFVAGQLLATGFSQMPGQLIAAEADGTLAPFFYFPEGQATSPKMTGAHLAFPEGAVLTEAGGEFVLSFGTAGFFRAGIDESPLPARAGPGQLVVGAVTPAAVAAAFDPGAGGLQLLFGGMGVDWLDGTLGPAGWAAQRVRIPIGDFGLPGTQTTAAVTLDPRDGAASLLVCHHGDWSPAPGGPAFRVPEGDPLKIYLDTRGEIRAHGTAEAEFPNGAKVKGSLAWRRPNFEFRFEGKGIVIPALAGLKTVLPESPDEWAATLPENPSAEELDEAAERLTGMRDSFRGLAQGGVAQTDPAAPGAFAALPSPTDPAGAALTAWAGRIVSWEADRAGQALGEVLGGELTEVIRHGGKAAAAAQDLPTALKFLRELAEIQRRLGTVGAGAERVAVEGALAVALAQAAGAAGRILEARPEYDGDEETQAAVELLTEVIGRLPEAPQPVRARSIETEAELRDQVFRLSAGLQARVPFRLFTDMQVTKGDFRQDNPVLGPQSLAQLFRFLGRVETVFDLLRQTNRELQAIDAPAEFPVLEALLQSQPFLAARHQEEAARALARQDAALAAKVLRDRRRLFELYRKFGVPLASDTGVYPPLLSDFLVQYEPLLAKTLSTLEPGARVGSFTDFLIGLQAIKESVSDPAALDPLVSGALARMTRINDSFASLLAGDPKCDALVQELIARGETVLSAPPGYEGQQVPPISGKYQSIAGTLPRRTLQVNAGGRFFLANLQFHQPGSPLRRFELRGMLARETATTTEYSYLRIDPASDRIITTGTLTAATSNGATVISLKDRSGGTSVFVRTTTLPAYSAGVIDLFSGEAREMIEAQQRSPLHSEEADLIADAAEEAKEFIRDHLRPGAAPFDQTQAALALEQVVREAGEALATEHTPFVRLLFRLRLSRDFPSVAEPAIDDSDLTYFNWLLFVFNQHRAIMPKTAAMLGLVPDSIDVSEIFTYDVKVQTSVFGGDVVGVGVGSGLMTVEVQKTAPGGAQSTFRVKGPVGQAGAGPGVGIGVTISNDNFTFKSPFDYQVGDFAGPVSMTGGSATVAALAGVQISLGSVVFFGSGRLPPVSYMPDVVDVVFGASVGAGVDQGFGVLSTEAAFDATQNFNQTAGLNPTRFEAKGQGTFDTATDFRVDSAVINDCGWQNLREFVAEYRAIFASPTARVLVVGMTDTTAGEPYNLTLSQSRANSVRDALLAVMGPFDTMPDDRVSALGLGELAASSNVPLSAFPNNAVRTLVEFLRVQNATVANNVDAPEWRRVVIIINDLVTTEVGHPKDIVTQ